MSRINPIKEMQGVQPEVRAEFALLAKAMAGDMVLSITPATVAPAPDANGWTRKVVVELQTAAGEVHTWFNKTIATTVSVGDTSSAGTATIASTSLIMVNGRAEITVTGSNHAWLNSETDTLTIANITVMGSTITGGTSVETFTTP